MGIYEYEPGADDSGKGPLGGDSDDDSSEHVLGDLGENERLLRAHGHLPPSDSDAYEEPPEEEVLVRHEVPPTMEELAESLSETLGTIGLYGADAITAERLSRADPEVLAQLTPHTAESLYYETFRASRKWLGNEPVRLGRLVKQAKAVIDRGQKLEQLQLLQRQSDVGKLRSVYIDPDQLLQLLTGEPGAAQNVNRLSFYLFDEPKLQETVKIMKKVGADDGPWSVEEVVISTQELLRMSLAVIKSDARQDKRRGLHDSIYHDHLDRTTHRIGSSIAIGGMILEDMRGATTYGDFLRRTTDQ